MRRTCLRRIGLAAEMTLLRDAERREGLRRRRLHAGRPCRLPRRRDDARQPLRATGAAMKPVVSPSPTDRGRTCGLGHGRPYLEPRRARRGRYASAAGSRLRIAHVRRCRTGLRRPSRAAARAARRARPRASPAPVPGALPRDAATARRRRPAPSPAVRRHAALRKPEGRRARRLRPAPRASRTGRAARDVVPLGEPGVARGPQRQAAAGQARHAHLRGPARAGR